MRPDLAEIDATVRRLEAALAKSTDPEIIRLLAAYRAVERRFAADLDDPRDLALSRGAALMLIKTVRDSAT